MQFRLIFFFLFINVSLFSQNTSSEIEIEYTDHFGQRDILTIEFYIKNNSSDTVIIHHPRALNYRPNGHPPVLNIPDFYQLNVLTEVDFCEIAPYFIDSGKGVPTKKERDFLKIPPQSQQQILFSNRGTDQMICDENIEEIKVKLTYDFDKRYLDRFFFKKEITQEGKLSPQESEQLYQLLKKSYHGKIESEEITLDLKNMKRHSDETIQKSKAIRKAKRTYGIDILDFIMPNHMGTVPAIKVNVNQDFQEENLEKMQKQITSSLFHASHYHTVVSQNEKIKWFLGSQRGKNSPVHIYDYQTVIDSFNLTLSLLTTEKKDNPVLKDLEIVNIYLPVQNMGASSYRLLDKSNFVILKNQEEEFFGLSFRKVPIYKTQLIPLTVSEVGFEQSKRSYGSPSGYTIYLYRKLENGDLVYGTKDHWDKGLERAQGYFIQIK